MATGRKDRRFGDADTHAVQEALENRRFKFVGKSMLVGERAIRDFHLHFALLFTFSSAR